MRGCHCSQIAHKGRPGHVAMFFASQPAPSAAHCIIFYDGIPQDDSDASGSDKDEDDASWAKAVTAGKLSKGDKLAAVDHATMEYPPFRRNFYIEVSVQLQACVCSLNPTPDPPVLCVLRML